MADYDITTDLVDGSDGALGDPRPQNGAVANTTPVLPEGTEPAHGQQVKHVNTIEREDRGNETSLRDQLSNAFKGTEQTNKPATEQAPQVTALTKDSEGKYRLPDGTFASQDQITAFEAGNTNTATNDQQQSSQYENVLRGFTAQELQQFQSLPAELQQFVGRTMEDLNTRASRYGEYDLIESQIIGPRREALAAMGATPAVAINQLFAIYDFANSDPGAYALWFAQQNNLDLDQLLDERDERESANPEVRQLREEMDRLKGKLTERETTEASQTHERNLAAVQTFSEAKGSDGKPLRPYINDVMTEWGAQVAAVRNANPNMPNEEVLDRAYNNACWANPTVRAKMQEADQADRAAREAERVAAAKAAGSSVSGGPLNNTNGSANNPNRTLREELEYNLAQQSA